MGTGAESQDIEEELQRTPIDEYPKLLHRIAEDIKLCMEWCDPAYLEKRRERDKSLGQRPLGEFFEAVSGADTLFAYELRRLIRQAEGIRAGICAGVRKQRIDPIMPEIHQHDPGRGRKR